MTCRADGTGSLHQFLQGYDVDCHNSQEGWGVFIPRLQGGYFTTKVGVCTVVISKDECGTVQKVLFMVSLASVSSGTVKCP